MYISILRKDLKRKKTMNFILLLFVILATTFIASSVNNLLSIMNAMEGYIEKSQMGDYVICAKELPNQVKDEFHQMLNESENVDRWVSDKAAFLSKNNICYEDGTSIEFNGTSVVSSIKANHQKFFKSDNSILTDIKQGEVYVNTLVFSENDLESGDKLVFEIGKEKIILTVKGAIKDIIFGSSMMGATRFLLSEEDFNKLYQESVMNGEMYSIYTNDLEQFVTQFNEAGIPVMFSGDKNLIKTSYLMDMIIAGMLLVVSVCLILISFLILRFTIHFTLAEEYREIGIMKAIGIKNLQIRGLYIVKYVVLSVVGALIGLLLSIPFGKMMIEQVSKTIVMEAGSNIWYLHIGTALAIVLIIQLFSLHCTGKIKKYSPVDAIRNGSNGERFKGKGFIRLHHFRWSPVTFLAINDIFSNIKRFGVLILTFTLGIILITLPVNTVSTLRSENIIPVFGMAKSDAYLLSEEKLIENIILAGDAKMIRNYLQTFDKALEKEGIKATTTTELFSKNKVTKGEKSYASMALQGINIKADRYTYSEGIPPMLENEVALTHLTADYIDAKIGDTIRVKLHSTEKEFIVTALYQSMNNMGEGIRFSECFTEFDYKNLAGVFAIQITFDDSYTEKEKEEYFEQLKTIFPEYEVMTGEEFLSHMLGGISDSLESIGSLIVMVVIFINMLVTVLMVKSFMTKERAQIGTMKAIGFHNGAIMRWQCTRIGIVMIVAAIIGLIISYPLLHITIGPIFRIMGAENIEFTIQPLQAYIIYPGIVFVGTMIASILTTLGVRRISAQETNSIE